MVTTSAHYTDPRYRTTPGDGYDGVVRISVNNYYATGSLLYDGRAILTAGHLFDPKASSAIIRFETAQGIQTYTSTQILRHPGYDQDSNNDLAIVWLPTTAPISADRYELYRNNDEISKAFVFAGYGRTGTGNLGTTDTQNLSRLKAANQFDADAATLKSDLGASIAWTPKAGTQLIADFDNGNPYNDAFGRLIARDDLGLRLNEGLIAQGDSGGPAFLDGYLAGVASYTASLSKNGIHPDIDSTGNSSFGELAAWQRVSAYQQWIDQNLRAHYPDAPTTPEEVVREVVENNTGTSYAYFLLQFTGVRSDPNEILSIDYSTRNGTAEANEDYIAVNGTLNLYPNENKAVIPVEIIGDTQPEADEYFYLDVFNPVGGSFGEGVVKLSAVRTILDDDGWMG
ncbi:trypsin-like serine protease [Neopusillimonas aromaticivorans]|uniref:trypsin-like serine protease n=1 Tax=Neopusillimonas aromaticivorans TaxID=2979868 RepID=UPI002591646C|nr:trypsin-like serine protease [Neopusillimonas aromaticivorans]WJJ92891.1 trypsin-like serine protease [Neopusillimonas aromaticivorans]